MPDIFRLCYCEGDWAWFTTCPIDKQWGDDWNDVPYEHNAGEPYEWREGCGVERYQLIKVAWEGPYDLPGEHYANSPFSVESINRGDIAWLRPCDGAQKGARPIHAGASLDEFAAEVSRSGGAVYLQIVPN